MGLNEFKKNSPESSEQGSNRNLPQNQEGRFVKGKSGNPGGRPKAIISVQNLARDSTVEAINTLVSIMRSGAPIEKIQAIKLILERGWGKPGLCIENQETTELIPSITISLKKEN